MALAPCRECGLQVSTEAATCPRAIRRLTKPGAKYECQARIRAGLRSPRTAHFSGLGETRILSVPGEGYRVIGWVDAQNGFGGEVRTPAMQVGLTTRRLTLREIFPLAMLLWLSKKVKFPQSTGMPLAT